MAEKKTTLPHHRKSFFFKEDQNSGSWQTDAGQPKLNLTLLPAQPVCKSAKMSKGTANIGRNPVQFQEMHEPAN